MTAPSPPVSVIAPVHPLVSGVAQFNTAMIGALREFGPVQALSWRRLYPPFIHRRDALDTVSRPLHTEQAEVLLDWADPRSWREALRRVADSGAQAMILPWVHPVMAPPYRYLLRHAPSDVTRVVICHNVAPHHRVLFASQITRSVLKQADLLVIHAAHQRDELKDLGLADTPTLHSFLPPLTAAELCELPSEEMVRAERLRQGNPEISLLAFGAIRPYKGLDNGLKALARVHQDLSVKLIIAGVFWKGTDELAAQVHALGLDDRVELRDGYQSNEETALLFSTADASLLPYRSASQSGVVAMSFAYGCPVIATAVGGLQESVTDGSDGILCEPDDIAALTAAIERMATEKERFARGILETRKQHSSHHYAEMLTDAIAQLRTRPRLQVN